MGALIAVVGSFLTQRSIRLNERMAWAREQQREAHVAFLAEFDDHTEMISRAEERRDGSEPDHDFLLPVWRKFESVRLFCGSGTAAAGEQAMAALMRYAFRSTGSWQDVDDHREEYVTAVRAEFGLAPVPAMRDVWS